jgi:hypothetical protein
MLSLTSCKDTFDGYIGGKIKNCDDCLVQNEETAVSIAEAILFETYGKSNIEKQRPYIINIKNDSIWVLDGTFNSICFGGTFHIELSSKNGKVLKIIHGK